MNSCGLPLSSACSTAASSPMPQRSRTFTITRWNGSWLGMSVGVCAVIWQAAGFGLAAETDLLQALHQPGAGEFTAGFGQEAGIAGLEGAHLRQPLLQPRALRRFVAQHLFLRSASPRSRRPGAASAR